jgi:hypothetical protein
MSKWNYFSVETVDGYSFPEVPQVNFNFLSQGFSFLNRGSNVIQYSFDGTTLHGDLNPSDSSASITFDHRIESKVWFRGGDGYGDVRVEAWGGWGRS